MRFDFKNNPKLGKLVTIILIGLLLLVIAFPVKKTDIIKENASEGVEDSNQSCSQDSAYYEARLKAILENSYGEGTMSVMVNMSVSRNNNSFYGDSEEEKRVDGVLVVASVSDANAVSDITYAVCALFDLPVHKVAVILKE